MEPTLRFQIAFSKIILLSQNLPLCFKWLRFVTEMSIGCLANFVASCKTKRLKRFTLISAKKFALNNFPIFVSFVWEKDNISKYDRTRINSQILFQRAKLDKKFLLVPHHYFQLNECFGSLRLSSNESYRKQLRAKEEAHQRTNLRKVSNSRKQ